MVARIFGVGLNPMRPPMFTSILSAFTLLNVTKTAWLWFGYNTGWVFPTIVGVIGLIFGNPNDPNPLKNANNQALWYGALFGCILYGVLSLF